MKKKDETLVPLLRQYAKSSSSAKESGLRMTIGVAQGATITAAADRIEELLAATYAVQELLATHCKGVGSTFILDRILVPDLRMYALMSKTLNVVDNKHCTTLFDAADQIETLESKLDELRNLLASNWTGDKNDPALIEALTDDK